MSSLNSKYVCKSTYTHIFFSYKCNRLIFSSTVFTLGTMSRLTKSRLNSKCNFCNASSFQVFFFFFAEKIDIIFDKCTRYNITVLHWTDISVKLTSRFIVSQLLSFVCYINMYLCRRKRNRSWCVFYIDNHTYYVL